MSGVTSPMCLLCAHVCESVLCVFLVSMFLYQCSGLSEHRILQWALYEADHHMVHLAEELAGKGSRAIIISEDGDMAIHGAVWWIFDVAWYTRRGTLFSLGGMLTWCRDNANARKHVDKHPQQRSYL
jgi:hypothetical protein